PAEIRDEGTAPSPTSSVHRSALFARGRAAKLAHSVAFPLEPPRMPESDPSRIAHGGKGLYGSRVGILMLETRFPRIPGDMGNGQTWPFPVLYKVVPGATPDRGGRPHSAGPTN